MLGSVLSFNVMAAQMTPEQQAANAVATRQSVFHLLSFSNAPLGSMARGGEYNEEAAKTAIMRIETLAPMIPEVFGAMDTRQFKDIPTRANDTIWDNMADVKKLASDLEAGAKEAMDIINSKGADGVRDAVRAIGPKCGACHDRFRLD